MSEEQERGQAGRQYSTAVSWTSGPHERIVRLTGEGFKELRSADERSLARKRGERGNQGWARRALAAATDDDAEAVALYGEALDNARTLKMRPLEAQIRLGRAQRYQELGHRGAARDDVAVAIELFLAMELSAGLAEAQCLAAQLS